jgi:hypothetical protein
VLETASELLLDPIGLESSKLPIALRIKKKGIARLGAGPQTASVPWRVAIGDRYRGASLAGSPGLARPRSRPRASLARLFPAPARCLVGRPIWPQALPRLAPGCLARSCSAPFCSLDRRILLWSSDFSRSPALTCWDCFVARSETQRFPTKRNTETNRLLPW